MIECVCSIMKITDKNKTEFISVVNIEQCKNTYSASSLFEALQKQADIIQQLEQQEVNPAT